MWVARSRCYMRRREAVHGRGSYWVDRVASFSINKPTLAIGSAHITLVIIFILFVRLFPSEIGGPHARRRLLPILFTFFHFRCSQLCNCPHRICECTVALITISAGKLTNVHLTVIMFVLMGTSPVPLHARKTRILTNDDDSMLTSHPRPIPGAMIVRARKRRNIRIMPSTQTNVYLSY